ncbi:MAG: TonB-dependent receptor plug domain-containing protein [Cycloclasticus sp.]|jgi:iron complex outermembrane receptor protein|nr:TonB-dependent receptor plug domain-containing protein [Cycloclasticus sp.]
MQIIKTLPFSTRHFLITLLSCSLSPFVGANEIDDLSFFNTDIPIVLSATRLAQPQTEAPASITLIDRQMIKLSGAKAIPELFRLVPGMHVNYFRGNSPTVGYQGLNSEYPQGVQVLVDGRSMYNPLFGGVNWRSFPISIDEIERIEVIRGSNSTSFGSNAFQSVVSITTIHASQTNGIQLKSTIGERGYQRSYLRAGHSFSDLDFRFSASHIDNNGYDNNADDTRQDMLSARLDYQITPLDSIQINASANNTLLESVNPNTSDFDPIGFDPTDPRRNLDESNFALHAKWEHLTQNDQQFITQLSYARFKTKDAFSTQYTDPVFGPTLINVDYTTAFDRWHFEFEHQLKPTEKTRLTWGLSLRNDRTYLPLWTGTRSKHDNSLQRLFSNLEWRPINDLIINVGALWEHSQRTGDDFAPRLAANYLLTPLQSLRFIASQSFRSPVIVESDIDAELQFNITGGPLQALSPLVIPIFESTQNLTPEVVDSIELGYHGLFIDNTLTLDLKLFRNEYDRLIGDIECPTCDEGTLAGFPFSQIPPALGGPITSPIDVRTLLNRHQVNVNGYEIEVNYKPNKQNLIHVGYAYNHANVGSKKTGDIGNIYSSIPTDVFNALVAHTFDNGLWASAAFYYTGSLENLDSGQPLGPMRRLDLNTGKTFRVTEGQNLEFNLSLQLALDKNKDFLNEFMLDNRAFIEVNYNYQ